MERRLESKLCRGGKLIILGPLEYLSTGRAGPLVTSKCGVGKEGAMRPIEDLASVGAVVCRDSLREGEQSRAEQSVSYFQRPRLRLLSCVRVRMVASGDPGEKGN